MGQIRITPDDMRTRSGEYSTEGENLEAIIEKMDTLLTNLQSEWEGAASEAYAEKFSQLRPSFVAAKELIDEIAAALSSIADDMETLDSNISSSLLA